MNATSSRAHTVVTIVFDQISKNQTGQETKKSSNINLVDLAGLCETMFFCLMKYFCCYCYCCCCCFWCFIGSIDISKDVYCRLARNYGLLNIPESIGDVLFCYFLGNDCRFSIKMCYQLY